MRFLYKRPQAETVQEELKTVFEVMGSELFIYLDLFLFSIIFTLLLSTVIKSFTMVIVFLVTCYSIFSCLYILLFKLKVEKS
ncbi:hypothetical protein HW35_02880 [Bacillus sp. X1(2014)]|nr:hypothetical protein HW35_02880 [Bacillus sp. X1(2014)]